VTTNPRSLAVRYDEDGKVTWLICELCTEWTSFDDLYRDGSGDVFDICRWCGEGTQRPHVMVELPPGDVLLAATPTPKHGIALATETIRNAAYLPKTVVPLEYSGWNALWADRLDDLSPDEFMEILGHVEIWIAGGTGASGLGYVTRFEWLTFDMSQPVGQVPCHECGGTGWWGFGPVEAWDKCVDCKGTGREWVGLW
jgi:hypothetical protein